MKTTLPTNANYWKKIIHNAEIAAKDGRNLEDTIILVSKALDILKAAMPT